MKKKNRILHMPISNVSIERMDLEAERGLLPDGRTV